MANPTLTAMTHALVLEGPDYDVLCKILRREYGRDLTEIDPALVQTRLQAFCNRHGLSSVAECVELLQRDEAGLREVGDVVYSHGTWFNREPSQFEFLVRTAEQQRAGRGTPPAGDLSVWCLACSTGQEAYTAAVYLMEHLFPGANDGGAFHVRGGDCSMSSLRIAEQGRYSVEDVRRLEPMAYTKYFATDADGCATALPALRRKVTFEHFNLLTSAYPFRDRVDFVFLRCALGFHKPRIRMTILAKVHASLKDGGHLILEPIPDRSPLVRDCGFESVAPGCYRIVRR
jgi:chemotaxis protein methyltransferase CheR